MAGPVAGDADLEARGLVIFEETLLSSAAGGLLRGGEEFVEPEHLLELFSERGESSEALSNWGEFDLAEWEAGFPEPNYSER